MVQRVRPHPLGGGGSVLERSSLSFVHHYVEPTLSPTSTSPPPTMRHKPEQKGEGGGGGERKERFRPRLDENAKTLSLRAFIYTPADLYSPVRLRGFFPRPVVFPPLESACTAGCVTYKRAF